MAADVTGHGCWCGSHQEFPTACVEVRRVVGSVAHACDHKVQAWDDVAPPAQSSLGGEHVRWGGRRFWLSFGIEGIATHPPQMAVVRINPRSNLT